MDQINVPNNTSLPNEPIMPEHINRHPRTTHLIKDNKTNSWKIAFHILIVLIILGGVGTYFTHKNVFKMSYKNSEKTDTWQAVFLANGQVYFGHLKERISKFPKLTDIYYLQVNQQNLQQPTDTTNKTTDANTTADTTKPQVSLIKLGEELHGPKDEMFISKDQILFWEDLKDDSSVVKAIKDFKK